MGQWLFDEQQKCAQIVFHASELRVHDVAWRAPLSCHNCCCLGHTCNGCSFEISNVIVTVELREKHFEYFQIESHPEFTTKGNKNLFPLKRKVIPSNLLVIAY